LNIGVVLVFLICIVALVLALRLGGTAALVALFVLCIIAVVGVLTGRRK
jgi:hypothetical protein